MNGCDSNPNAMQPNSNTNNDCITDCDNENLVFISQPLLEFVNQTTIGGELDQILSSDIKNVMSALKILIQNENMNNTNRQHNALLIAKSVLSSQSFSVRKEMALLFISDDELIKCLIHLEEYFIVNDVNHEPIIETYYHVMTKLSYHKKFSQKIYSNHKSSLVNTLCLLERWKHKFKIVSTILCYLKHLLKSSLCAQILLDAQNSELSEKINSKNGLINIIYDILCTHKIMSFSSTHAIETLAIISRCKEGISNLLKIASYYIPLLVKLFDESALLLTDTNRDNKFVLKCLRFSYSVLGVFLHLSYVKSGREQLIHYSIEHKILVFMKNIVKNKIKSERAQHLDRVFVLSSLVIQRCLDPLPLPLSSHFNPNLFDIPLNGESMKKSKSLKNCSENDCNIDENYDYYESQSDSDIESIDQNDSESIHLVLENKTLVSYEQYFPEIKDFDWNLDSELNNSFTDECSDESNTTTGCKERKKSKENIKSLFCSCFSNNQNNENNVCDKEGLNCHEMKDNRMDTNYVKELMNSAKEDKRNELFMESADWRQVYTSMAAKTLSIQPILSLAEPELSENIGNNKLEPLAINESTDLYERARIKLLEHIIQRFDGKSDQSFVVFDIESQTNEINKKCLQFESRFESGNLRKVIQNSLVSNEYILLLNTDINTCSHVQWFYFRVSNIKADVEYVFNIINCEKQSSLYNEGQRPVIFSTKESQMSDKPFWKRVGHSIAYYRNHYVKDDSIASLMNGKTYYTLTFKIKFLYDNDICYLAYNYPHSYSYLKSCIHFWQNCHNSCNIYFKHQTLCTSLVGNEVPVLTITSSKPTPNRSVRKYIVLIGRVHPGESNSSWIIKGCIDFLLSDRMSAQKLCEKYVFKIIPMTNPDGVINGNSRTDAQGDDLNRQWRRPDPLLHPIIFHSKELIKYLSYISNNSNPIVLVDFHGHSRRKNIFLYGCCSQMSWKKSDRNKCEDQSYLALPLILNSMAPAFSLENCCYNIEQNRERTARIAIWRELDLKLSYTLECSQAGCDQGLYEGMHLGINQLTEMGSKFCSTLLKLEFTNESNNCRPIPIIPKELLIESNDIISEKKSYKEEEEEETKDENQLF